MKRLAFFGDKQEQGLVSLEPTAHVKNLMKYFFPFLSPKGALWVHPSFSSISGMSSLSLINTPLTFVIQLPFASKSTGCSCTCTSAPSEGLPWAGVLWPSIFFLHFTPAGLPFLGGSWPRRCFLGSSCSSHTQVPRSRHTGRTRLTASHATPSHLRRWPPCRPHQQVVSRSWRPHAPRVCHLAAPSGQPRGRSPAGKSHRGPRAAPAVDARPALGRTPLEPSVALGMRCGGNRRARASRPRAERRGSPTLPSGAQDPPTALAFRRAPPRSHRLPPRRGSGKPPAPSFSRRPRGKPGCRCPRGKGAAGLPGGGISSGRGRRRSFPPGAAPAPLPLRGGPPRAARAAGGCRRVTCRARGGSTSPRAA